MSCDGLQSPSVPLKKAPLIEKIGLDTLSDPSWNSLKIFDRADQEINARSEEAQENQEDLDDIGYKKFLETLNKTEMHAHFAF